MAAAKKERSEADEAQERADEAGRSVLEQELEPNYVGSPPEVVEDDEEEPE